MKEWQTVCFVEKKLGFLESPMYEVVEDDRGTCLECHGSFETSIKNVVDEFENIIECDHFLEVLKEQTYQGEALDYINKYVYIKRQMLEFDNRIEECLNCVLCGKEVESLDLLNYEISENDRGTCLECHENFGTSIKKVVSELNNTIEYNEFLETLQEASYDDEAMEYINEYLHGKRQNLKSLIRTYQLTTGYEFTGYTITEYQGVISGDAVLGTGFFSEFTASLSDFFGTQSNTFANKMIEVKNAAKQRLIEQSMQLGGNAIIGVDFDYVTFGNNMIGVSAIGTSVTIEKRVETSGNGINGSACNQEENQDKFC